MVPVRRAPTAVTRLLVAVAAVLVALAAWTGVAGAHATLTTSDPAPGARLASPPASVTLTYDEAVSVVADGTKVLDRDGARVDTGVSARDQVVTIALRPDLAAGGYVVSWRVISADSHPVYGAFTFTVGDGPAVPDDQIGTLAAQGDNRSWVTASGIGRGLAYGGALLVGGIGLFVVLALPTAAASAGAATEARRDRRRLGPAVAAGAAVAVLGLVVNLAAAAALASGRGLGALGDGVARAEALRDGVGLQALGVLVGLALVGIALLPWASPTPERSPAGRVARLGRATSVAGWVLCSASFAFAGHVTTSSPRAVATAADLVHLLAAAAWFGGLVALALVVSGRRRRARRAAEQTGGPLETSAALASAAVVLRFSRVATWSIVALAGAGAVLTWIEVRTWQALTTTTYGSLVIAKAAGFALVLALAAVNHFRIVPSLRREVSTTSATWTTLRRTVAAELGLLVAVLAVTAALTGTTPARSAVAPSLFTATAQLGQDTLQVTVDPPRTGGAAIHLYLLDPSGLPAADPDELTASMALPSAQIGPLELHAVVAGPGHYQVHGADLPLPGRWQLTVKARHGDFDLDTATIDVPIRR